MVIILAPCFYNLTITLAAHLYFLMHSMLDNVEHVQVFYKHLHTLQVRFAQRRKIITGIHMLVKWATNFNLRC